MRSGLGLKNLTVRLSLVDASYHVNCFRIDSCHDGTPFVLVRVVALFVVPVFIYFFQKVLNCCAQICGVCLGFRFKA